MKTTGISLRTKVTLALTLTTVIAVMIVGYLVKQMVFSNFVEDAMKRSYDQIRVEVTAYIEKYGSWQQGENIEDFKQFVLSRSYQKTPFNTNPVSDPSSSSDIFNRFLLANTKGMIMVGNGDHMKGEELTSWQRNQARSIMVAGETVALAIPVSEPVLSTLDQYYLNTLDRSLGYSISISGLLAVLIGIFFGNKLSASIRKLTDAINSMRPGEIRKDVEVKTGDEVALLAGSFNKMSHQLADAYEELEQAHEQLTEQATELMELSVRDELTGLYNRRHFDEQAAHFHRQAKRYDRPFTLMLGDIDFFKKINDTYGHAVGDEVLKQVAKLLQTSLRDSDLIARYGGEEFIILFPETEMSPAFDVCERLRLSIESYPWHTIEENLKVTLSMGLSDEKSLNSFRDILVKADERLYFAKENGRNLVAA